MRSVSIREWLAAAGLSGYTELFEQNRIELDVLSDLSEHDLLDLGIALGDRKRLLKAIQSWTQLKPATAESDSPLLTQAPQAERRQLTVLFCDLVGSTQLSQQLDGEDLRALMQRYQQVCRSAIERYEGYIAQFLGDGIMAYFGWPTAHEDDAERAVRSALEIISRVKEVEAPSPLSVHIGVATGPVVVGEESGEDATVPKLAVGETPNLAARLQSLAVQDQLVIAPSTRRLLGETFVYEDLGQRVLKGIVERVRAWRVVNLSQIEERFYATRSFQSGPLIGREEELSLLFRRWQQAKEGEGQVVLLCGEAGIGKSRLGQALRNKLSGEDPYQVRYQCSPYHKNSAFYPIVEQLKKAAKLNPTDTPHDKLGKIKELLAGTELNNPNAVPLVAALLEIPTEGQYAPLNYAPQKQKDETIQVLVQQLIELAKQAPVLVTLEDAHWLDPSAFEAC
jgi:class 3 adenylate cyclase